MVFTCPVCQAPTRSFPRGWTSGRQTLRIVRPCGSCGASLAFDEAGQQLEVLHPDTRERPPSQTWRSC